MLIKNNSVLKGDKINNSVLKLIKKRNSVLKDGSIFKNCDVGMGCGLKVAEKPSIYIIGMHIAKVKGIEKSKFFNLGRNILWILEKKEIQLEKRRFR